MAEKTIKDKTITSLYAELNKFNQNGEYERSLKTSNKILGVAPHEFLAFQCKMVCLIHLSRFEEAISLMNKNPQFLQEVIFEKAYSYYRVNKPEEALKTIELSENELDFRCKELKAQILYRLEQYDNSVSIYRDIIKNMHDDDYDDERYTNLSAAMVHLKNENAMDTINEFVENTYEQCYNKACLLIEYENYLEAEKKLKQCEKMCREMLEEDETTEEEIDIELALIRIQLAYVYQKQGRTKESQLLYTGNLKLKLDDIALMAVASNNIACINKDQNLFDSKKKMKVALNDGLVFKLPSKQRKLIALNNAILNYYINQTDQCEKACKLIDERWPELQLQTATIRALNLIKADKSKDAIDLLNKIKTKDDNLYINLSIAQIYLMQGEKAEACQILENLGEARYKPGIVGALTTLYLGIGKEDVALKVFEKTVEFYKKNNVKGVNLSQLWRQAAEFHIKKGLPQVAANSLEELLKTNKNDLRLIAQLILGYAQFNEPKAVKLAAQLTPTEELAKEVDLDALEATALPTISFNKKSPSSKQESLPSTPRDESQKKTRKHKKRKGKLPKNYDALVAPDPERWLPKYERTGYRKKRDRRAKEVIKGSQGTASGQAEQYDFSKFVEDSSDTASTSVDPSPRPSSKSAQTHHKKSQQKKKGKRR
ncbi:signal recognition particle subunit SRP72 [Diabrotica virgifera virgifera]|uniref:Signal recognition particle subunit SRP72 n=1 Tax=Diabrotica virgifera virgifera TaxID=50390 RepID=A0A6P7H4R2_DIAVI|nr:signal recognition particle subunit SRP72 [Diabrotica virgifera virgifera]